MHPYLEIARLHSDTYSSRVAHGALPDAPCSHTARGVGLAGGCGRRGNTAARSGRRPAPPRCRGGAMGKVTLQTIADRVGVSRMTVSNAFSRPDQLSAELRDRILSTARELGYAGPDPTARALARGTTGAVGVLLTDSLRVAFTDEIAMAFLSGVVDGLAATGLALTLLTVDERDDVVAARDVAIDGAVVYSCHYDRSTARDWLLRRRLPLVYVDQDPQPGIPAVNVDDRGGARAAAQHVVDLGHRRIAILNAVDEGPVGVVEDPFAAIQGHTERQRMLGWLDALGAAGIEPTFVHTSPYRIDDATAAARALLSRSPRPTAVLCFSDVVAITLIRVAKRLGLRVPDDVSVVGFDDSPAAALSEPALTTVRQDSAAKGRHTAEALIAAIGRQRSGGPPARARRRLLPTELVVRDSTARPSTGRRSSRSLRHPVAPGMAEDADEGGGGRMTR